MPATQRDCGSELLKKMMGFFSRLNYLSKVSNQSIQQDKSFLFPLKPSKGKGSQKISFPNYYQEKLWLWKIIIFSNKKRNLIKLTWINKGPQNSTFIGVAK